MAAVTSCENTPFSINDLHWLCLYLQKKLNAGWLLDTRTCRKVAIAKIWPYGTCSFLRIFHSVWSWERIWSEAPVTKICLKLSPISYPQAFFLLVGTKTLANSKAENGQSPCFWCWPNENRTLGTRLRLWGRDWGLTRRYCTRSQFI